MCRMWVRKNGTGIAHMGRRWKNALHLRRHKPRAPTNSTHRGYNGIHRGYDGTHRGYNGTHRDHGSAHN